jgi:hypothetical protein
VGVAHQLGGLRKSSNEPFQKFLNGEPDDCGWHLPWLRLIRQVTASGKRIERVRIISEPHVGYTRWGLSVAPLNIRAGEDIRWLPRQMTATMDLTSDDFWLIDNERVVFTVFTPEGKFSGGAETIDPVTVRRRMVARDQAWAAAIPQADYAKL